MSYPAGTSLTIRKSITVDRPVAAAFHVYTAEITRWWPMHMATFTGEAERVTIEDRPGGRIFETTRRGEEVEWGRVLAWAPPHRLAYSYHPWGDDRRTEVEVSFTALGEGATRVDVEHRGWEAHGDAGLERRLCYVEGWDTTLSRFEAGLDEPAE